MERRAACVLAAIFPRLLGRRGSCTSHHALPLLAPFHAIFILGNFGRLAG
jgi:hypothetical protein